jgi:hypothetical protein
MNVGSFDIANFLILLWMINIGFATFKSTKIFKCFHKGLKIH